MNLSESTETAANADLAGQNERLVMSIDDWKAKAAKLYGDDAKQWRFKCPSCGEVQTGQEFIDNNVDDPIGKFYFSCTGRWVDGRGCNWTLGGLFQIHNVEVVNEEGEAVPVMEFADS